jgi:hypothetical protein
MKFPSPDNREFFRSNRELIPRNREFSGTGGDRLRRRLMPHNRPSKSRPIIIPIVHHDAESRNRARCYDHLLAIA